MEKRRSFVVLSGGRPAGAPSRRPRRSTLRVVHRTAPPEVERGLAEAVDAAREIREERERRIARALDRPDDRGA
jgi:hypothetical protein